MESASIRTPCQSAHGDTVVTFGIEDQTSRQAISAMQKALAAPEHDAVESEALSQLVSVFRDAGDYGSAVKPSSDSLNFFQTIRARSG